MESCSPLLYTTLIDALIKLLRSKKLGYNLLGRYSGLLVLAEDVAVISLSPSELQCMLDATDSYTK